MNSKPFGRQDAEFELRKSPRSQSGRVRLLTIVFIVSVCTLIPLLTYLIQTPKARDVQAEERLLADERKRLQAIKDEQEKALEKSLLERRRPARTASDELWKDFRMSFPYHSQVLALSNPSADGSRTLIVSEPPPHVTEGQILVPLSDLLLNHSVKPHPIGHDGWVKDVIVAISGTDQNVSQALSSLSRLLFHTSYKAYVLPLPARPTSITDYSLDLKVTAAELKHWILDEKGTFSPVIAGPSVTVERICQNPNSCLYFSDQAGLVGWWIPKALTIQACSEQARQFALDSDLIVGALSNSSGILVLGRDRVVPVDALPPLRVETLALLASVQKGQEGELKQSYERQHLFAGRLDRNRDWAPILLSPELVDTEYGSLLNITDQLLKGWSNNGETHYDNFDYPRPTQWPFPVPLPEHLNAETLTYNWNTKGVGYTVMLRNYTILALNRAGALPVSYIPEGAGSMATDNVSHAEDAAYEYFATLSDPNLVRVVQYAAMYQIFSAFDVARPVDPVPANQVPDTLLEQLTNGLQSEIQQASDQDLMTLSRKIEPGVRGAFGQFVDIFVQQKAKQIRDDLKEQGYQLGSEAYNSELQLRIRALRAIVTDRMRQALQSDNGLLSDIVGALASLRDNTEAKDEHQRMVKDFSLSALAAIRKLPERYAETIGAKANGWVHTPVVVISWNGAGMSGGIGGHNLDARVTRFKVSDEVRLGVTRIDDDGSILVNPKDAAKASEAVRTAARADVESADEIAARVNSVLARADEIAPRSMSEALGLPSSTPPVHSIDDRAIIGTLRPNRFSRVREALSSQELAAYSEERTLTPGLVVVERRSGNAIRIIYSERDASFIANNTPDAVDELVSLMKIGSSDSQTVSIQFRGFAPEEATGFVRSCEVRAADERIPKEISSFVQEDSITSEAIGELRSRQFDYSKAQVKISETEAVGVGEQHSTITVEVPLKNSSGPSAKTTFKVAFEKGTPREVIRVVMQRISDALHNLIAELGDRIDIMILNRRMNLEVKRICRETGVDAKVIWHQLNDGRRDMYFALNQHKDVPYEAPTAIGRAA